MSEPAYNTGEAVGANKKDSFWQGPAATCPLVDLRLRSGDWALTCREKSKEPSFCVSEQTVEPE